MQSAHELSSAPSHHHDPAGELGLAALMSLTGILLWPVGLIGTLFGLLVMSATSRQREFLADAFAVQFTRNPEGLAGALKVLAGCEAGSRVRTAKSLEAQPLLFCRRGSMGDRADGHSSAAGRADSATGSTMGRGAPV